MVVFEVWAVKAIGCLEPDGVLCGILEEKSIENSADNGDLTNGGQKQVPALSSCPVFPQ